MSITNTSQDYEIKYEPLNKSSNSVESDLNSAESDLDSAESNKTERSNDTQKILSKNESKIHSILELYGQNELANNIKDLINGNDCSVEKLTIFGDNYRIINKRTGEQFFVVQEGLIKGNVKFKKGFWPWSSNNFYGTGDFVSRNNIETVDKFKFNGEERELKKEVNYSKNKNIFVLKQANEEVVCCNDKMSKKEMFIRTTKNLLGTLQDFLAGDDAPEIENVSDIPKETVKGVIKIVPEAYKNLKEEFSPSKAIEDNKNKIENLNLAATPLVRDGLNLLFTDGNVIIDNNTSFKFGNDDGINANGKIELDNCSYIGYIRAKRRCDNHDKIASMKILSSKTQEYPCMLSFPNGDIIYGLQQDCKMTRGYYFANSENKVLPFDKNDENCNLKCLCGEIDNICALSTKQKKVIIAENKTRISFRNSRNITKAFQASYNNIYSYLFSKHKHNSKREKEQDLNLVNQSNKEQNVYGSVRKDLKRCHSYTSLRTMSQGKFAGEYHK